MILKILVMDDQYLLHIKNKKSRIKMRDHKPKPTAYEKNRLLN